MKSRVQLSKYSIPQKNAQDFYSNYRLALQLYYIYKSEAMAKKEPRLPLSDWRRPSKPHYHFFSLKNIRQLLSMDIIPLRKVLGWFSSHLNFNYINFLNK
jgi:hypothetical protein